MPEKLGTSFEAIIENLKITKAKVLSLQEVNVMKKLSWKNLGATCLLAAFLVACGGDENGQSVNSANNLGSTSVEKNLTTTTNNSGAGVVTISSPAEFKNKVLAGNFISISNFKGLMNAQNSSQIDLYFQVCDMSSWDLYEAEEGDGFWSNLWDSMTFDINSSKCTGSFVRSIFGGTIVRQDGLSRDQVKTSLETLVNEGTFVSYNGGASWNIRHGDEYYTVDLNFPMEANPTFKSGVNDKGETSTYRYQGFYYY